MAAVAFLLAALAVAGAHLAPPLSVASLLASVFSTASIPTAPFSTTPSGTLPLIAGQTGLALAALLIFGHRCWPGIFIGAFAASLILGHPWLSSLVATAATTLTASLGAAMLRHFNFDPAMTRMRDYFLLFLPAGVISSGAGSLLLALLWPGSTAVQAWQSNMLGIIVVTPMLLVWQHPPEWLQRGTFNAWQTAEFLTTLAGSLLLGSMFYLDWQHSLFDGYLKGYLMFGLVILVAVRIGRHGTVLVLGMLAILGMIGAGHTASYFSTAIVRNMPVNFTIYFATLTTTGMLLSCLLRERNVAMATLSESDERFMSFMQNMPGIAFIKDAQHNIIYRNNSAAAQRIERALTCPFDLAEAEMNRADDNIVLSDRVTVTSEISTNDAGRSCALLSIKFPLAGAHDTPLIGGLMLDITPRKRAEERVRQLTQLYRTLSHVNQSIVRLQGENELFPLVCQMVVQDGGMKMAWVGMPDENGAIHPFASHGDASGYLDGLVLSTSRDAHSPPQIALRERRHVIINHFGQCHPKSQCEQPASHGFRSTAAFPIMQHGEPYAVLSVFCEQTDAFDTESIALLDELSKDIGFALDNFERERQRQQAQAALENSEKRFRAFFERSMVGMATYSHKRGWMDANDALFTLLGRPRDQLLSMTWQEITHPDDLDINLVLYNRVLSGESDDYEIDKRFIRPDGSIVHVHVAVRGLRDDDGNIDYFAILVQDITESKKTAELIWKQANFDSLTSLINRNLFHDRLQHAIQKAERTGLPMALIFIDLDEFKEVNDSFGHAVGDALLVQAAERIGSCVRASDTLARLGGDEFVIILTDCADKAPAGQIARTIIARLAEPFMLPEGLIHVTASIGIAFFPDDAINAESLLSRADQAMYAAKNRGRNRFSYFTPSMQDAVLQRMSVANDLRSALAEGQFQLYFQPIVDLATNRIFKAEALIRWQHPKNGLISPKNFIPLAEETGLIAHIGDWVFREAAYWALRWAQLPQGGIQISVNKSPAQFLVQNMGAATWINYLQELGLPGKYIAIEITEGMLMNAEPAVMDKLLRFRDAGIQVALDDFGTGYSSLSYLNKFDIDYLKIDRSFVHNLATDPLNRALSEAIIVMAHTLGLKVIAEGVETEQQRILLAMAGCDYGQGFLFSRPLPAREFEALLS
ncbi:MAG: diguanylate cyclase/phosphodiesterase with and sensor(s) [Burkholderiaceae bacterium]|nr:diguanylate cyclase/phosphodiesterase with and sensor(s) [Burkholderiaceae bacterium]